MDSLNMVVLPLFGGAEKSSFEMSEQEFEQAAKAIKLRAKEKAFSKGLPIYSSQNNQIIAEYPDGTTAIIADE